MLPPQHKIIQKYAHTSLKKKHLYGDRHFVLPQSAHFPQQVLRSKRLGHPDRLTVYLPSLCGLVWKAMVNMFVK